MVYCNCLPKNVWKQSAHTVLLRCVCVFVHIYSDDVSVCACVYVHFVCVYVHLPVCAYELGTGVVTRLSLNVTKSMNSSLI